MRLKTTYVLAATLALGLAGCETSVPDSGSQFDGAPNSGVGVGFGGYAAAGAAPSTGAPTYRGLDDGANIGADTLAALGVQGTSGPTTPPVLDVPTGVAVPVVPANPDNAGISDSQSFEAVSGRETIADNAAKIAAQRQVYEQVPTTAVAARPSDTGPNLVEYALSTTNKVGQGIYSRSIILAETRYRTNCAKYSSSDTAQMDFLSAGGPKWDRKGLDPDGDGFACFWDPAPYRLAAKR